MMMLQMKLWEVLDGFDGESDGLMVMVGFDSQDENRICHFSSSTLTEYDNDNNDDDDDDYDLYQPHPH